MWCLYATLVWIPSVHAQEVEGLEKVLVGIQQTFPEEVASDELYRAALEGVAQHLGDLMGVDGNRVWTAEEHRDQDAWMDGHREGIGAEFTIIAGRGIRITAVFDDGPAASAGVEEGDVVVSMNDHPFTGQSASSIHGFVSQHAGLSTTLDLRKSDGAIRRVTVQRGSYRIPAVRTTVFDDNTPVARIPFFGKGTASAIAAFLRAQRSAHAVVIDLRDNEDGTMTEGIAAADLFLDPGSIVVNKGRTPTQMSPVTASEPAVWVRSVVVLVNQGTRGVAEAFAAALKDNGRGVLVGTRSAGLAVASSVYPAGRGYMMKVADVHLASPSGESWSRRGLAPNVVVESSGLSLSMSGVDSPPDLQRETAIRLISSSGVR